MQGPQTPYTLCNRSANLLLLGWAFDNSGVFPDNASCRTCFSSDLFPENKLRVAAPLISFGQLEKGGRVEFKGDSLHDGFGGSGEHFALFLFVLLNTAQRGNRDNFDGFGGFGGCGVSVVPATPLKLNPPFFWHPEFHSRSH